MIKKKKKKIKEISNYYAFRRQPTLPFWNKKAFLSLSLSRSFFVQIKKFSIYLLPGLNILLNLNQKFSVHRADSWIWRKYWDEKSIKTEMGINFFFPFFSSSISISLAILAPIQNDENEEREKWKKGKRNDPYRNHFLHPASRENLIKNCCL